MLRALLRRLATGAITLVFVTVLVFLLVHLIPGSPLAGGVDSGRTTRVPPEVLVELERLYHLDRPLHEQYLLWVGGLLQGDLGRSFHDRRPVASKIVERLGITMTLNGLALGLMVSLAVPLGALAAWKPNSFVDRAAAGGSYLAYSMPVFWIALLLQILLAVRLGWLPLAGTNSEGWETMGRLELWLDRARHLVLPVACLTYGGLAYLSRFVRATLIENAAVESAVAARARGLAPLAVLVRHGFRLAALPMLTLAGLLLPALVSGSVIVESIFAIPGLGRLFVDAAFQRDLPVLLGLTLLSGSVTLLGILGADLAYIVADPRIRRG